ncbi:mannose-1-phosphate guanylyltransferase [Canibacter zhoujuaniae]|uniref:mannose-1-phosphate guanylyltransferase n=1 Tax=Canibacter zhoujuaniae TaxID=2708343 RepID=UPI00141FC3CD|nr:mannose-1-phosphate guanylyltransferase [Canibacter zhoujuaniae]
MQNNENFWCVIPAGGVGSRLWPLSRADAPKFLLDLTDSGKSLLATTWDRLTPLTDPKRIMVVTGNAHQRSVREQLPDLAEANLVTESEPKDSSAAIGLAAALILRRDPQAIIGSFAADHVIGDEFLFQRAVHTAVNAAATGAIVTIGIRPTHAATGFGYIKTADPRPDIAPMDVFRVAKFVEKPDKKTAERYIRNGKLWNAGIFISRADVLLEQMAESEPELVAALHEIADAWNTPHAAAARERLWHTLPKIAIDYSVAEPAAAAGKMLCVSGHFSWDDVGDFASIANLLTRGRANDLAVLGKRSSVLAEKSNGIVISGSKRLVTVVGMDDVVVVDTPDVLLVTNKAHAQDVKKLVSHMRDSGNAQLL